MGVGSEVLNPLEAAQDWDSMVIADRETPGICDLGGPKRTNSWDVKKGKGTLGATVTFVGRDPVEFTATFTLWTVEQINEWKELQREVLEFDPTKTGVRAIGVYHPQLADIDVNSVVVKSIGGVTPAGKGKFTVAVEFLEYFPPPKKAASGTPNGSSQSKGANGKSTAPGTTPDPIADAQQAEIAALLKKAGEP